MAVQLTENARVVLERRYLQKDENRKIVETPEQLFRRVASAMSRVEEQHGLQPDQAREFEEKYYDLLASLAFIPNSPTLMNAGRQLGQLSACFVLPVEDSLQGIFDSLKHAALIHQSGGGTGFSFSRLRPKDDVVSSTGGVASGPVSFMRVFNAATEAVKQGGTRRGANMGVLRVDHPDILEFITCKEKNDEITNFNISVGLTSEFMAALEKDGEYDLINPRGNKPVGRLRARDVFELIVDMAWKNGEPGIVFLDRINEGNPTPQLGDIESTNPCVVGDALVPTADGLVPMERLVAGFSGQGVHVVTDDRVLPLSACKNGTSGTGVLEDGVTVYPISRAFDSGVKPVVRVTTEAGYSLEVTPDHKIMTTQGWVHAGDLKPGYHSVLLQSGAGGFPEAAELPFEPERFFGGRNGQAYRLNLPSEWNEQLGEVLGWLVGDGWLRDGDKNCQVGFAFAPSDYEAMERLAPVLNRWYGREVRAIRRANGVFHQSYHSRHFVAFFRELGVLAGKADGKRVPESLFRASRSAVVGFLRALFTAEGALTLGANQTAYARLTAKSRNLLEDVQKLLLAFGMKSRIYDRSRSPRTTFRYLTVAGETHEYATGGVLFELQVSREDLGRFLEEIGFIGSKYSETISALKARKRGFYASAFADKVASVVPAGQKAVFDLTEPVTHSFIANGIVVSNCGEQPLLPYEACNLGSLNLSLIVKEADKKKEVDWESLEQVTRLAVRFLDDVIDASRFPLPEIEKMVLGNRKVGLGVMGFADLLVTLGIPYDSEEAVALAGKLMAAIQKASKDESAELAEARGAFPNYPGSVYDVKGGRKYRNATTTTIAPTGTISIIAGCSSGIEPLFAIAFVRNVMDGDKLVEVNPFFEKTARERGFYSKELIDRIAEVGSVQGFAEIPEEVRRVFVVAHDIAPEWHVRIQAAFQVHTDNAVSKTVNFRHDASRGEVRQVFELAYQLGCKGVTVYRDGSRDAQVLSFGNGAEKPQPEAQEIVGTENDQAALATGVIKPNGYWGHIRPLERPQRLTGVTDVRETPLGNLYLTLNLLNNKPFELFAQIGKAGSDVTAFTEAMARLISLAFRCGVDPQEVADQLLGIGASRSVGFGPYRVRSVPDAIGQFVDAFLKSQEEGYTLTDEQTSLGMGQPELLAWNDQRSPGAGQMATAADADGVAAARANSTGVGEPGTSGTGGQGQNQASQTPARSRASFNLCPVCGMQTMIHMEGCAKCLACGHSEC